MPLIKRACRQEVSLIGCQKLLWVFQTKLMPESISKVAGETEYMWSQHCPCESFNLLICQYLSLRLFKQDMHLLIGHANMQKAMACQVTVPPWELTFQQIVGTCSLPDLEIESFSLFYCKI